MRLLSSCVLLGACVAFHVRDASACGGCFAPQSEVTIVTDHRMALAISPQQTVLWDQIVYQGDPREFAWVLPVREGAKLELSRDQWFSALDQSTQTIIYPPGGNSFMCALGGCADTSSGEANSGGGSGQDPEAVDVLSQSVVGPYETVTLRSTDPDALMNWLAQHGYVVPKNIEPVIAEYQAQHFDFIALRLRPGCNVRAMKPVRVVTPGADPTLPLRMVAAGVGANVGITLFVIGEGRWKPSNFPDAIVPFENLTWDGAARRSNYKELSQSALASNGGRGWLTEFAGKTAQVATSYYATCNYQGGGGGGPQPPCDRDDAGSDAASSDAAVEAASDAAAPLKGCAAFDDLEVAMRGIHSSDLWITRLRAFLPSSALDRDLLLEAGTQTPVSNTHYAVKAINCRTPSTSTTTKRRKVSCASTDGPSSGDLGSITLVALTAGVLTAMRRRKR